MAWREGFKVVGKDYNGWFRSCFAGQGDDHPGMMVKYRPGFRTKRPVTCGPLAVFADQKAADAFYKRSLGWKFAEGWKLMRCLYLESEEHELYTPMRAAGVLPPGTECADEVVLLTEEVKS